MARIKVWAFLSLSVVFLEFASAKSSPSLWHELEPKFQGAPLLPYAPQVPEGRTFTAVVNIAMRKNYDTRLKSLLETVMTLNETAKDQRKEIEELLAKIELHDSKILKLQEKPKCKPETQDQTYESLPPIIIYTHGSPKGHYGSYKHPEPYHIYPMKGHYAETDYYPTKYEYHDEDTDYHSNKMEHYGQIYIYEKPKGYYGEGDDYNEKPKGHYGEGDDYEKPKGHYENTDDYDKPKDHYEEKDDYEKPNGHYGKSETQTNSSSKKKDGKPISNPKQESSEGKSIIDNSFDGYEGRAKQEGDFYTQYYPSRYRSGKELKSESKNVKESLKESSENSSQNKKS